MEEKNVRFSSSNNTKLLDCILWAGFTLWLIIDTITGFALNSGINLPLSQVFKVVILLFLVIRVSSDNRYLKLSFLILLYLSIYALVLILHERDVSSTFVHLTKLISTFYIYIYFCVIVKIWQSRFVIKANKILIIAFIILSINIGLGFFGVGFHTYPDEQVGYKGFFFAGNELGGVIAAVIPFILYVVYLNYKLSKYTVISIFILFLSYLLATKSVLIICFVSTFAIPWILGSKKERKRIVIIGIILGIPFILWLIYKILSSESELIIKLTYAYETKGFMGLIFSGRDEFLAIRGDEFYNGDISTLLMGIGENITVELDLFDSLLNYGYIGFIINLFIYLYLLIVAYKLKNNNTYVPILIFQNWLIILMSLIAGHIVYSSMAGLYIALINSFVYIKNKSRCLISLKKY